MPKLQAGRAVCDPRVPVGQYTESTAVGWGGRYPEEAKEDPENDGMLLRGEVAELLGQVSPPCMRRATWAARRLMSSPVCGVGVG